MTVQQQISRGLFLLLVAVASVSAQSGSTAPTVETILVRMSEARAENRARFRPYVITRGYTLFGKERNKSKAEVTAEVTFVPPNSKQFSIQQSIGSALGERLVRRMLEGETKVVEDYGSTDISADNYDFRFAGEETINNQRCYVLELLPKRKQKNSPSREGLGRCQQLPAASHGRGACQKSFLVAAKRADHVFLRRGWRNVAANGFRIHDPRAHIRPAHDDLARHET